MSTQKVIRLVWERDTRNYGVYVNEDEDSHRPLGYYIPRENGERMPALATVTFKERSK